MKRSGLLYVFLFLISVTFGCGSKGGDSAAAASDPGGGGSTPDTTAPTAGTAISFSGVSATSLSVNWGAATDAVTAQASLEYKVVKDDAATANIDTVAEVDAKAGGDLLQDYTANITTKAVTGLTASTTYHFAIVVRDAAGNKAIYTPASQTTSATPDVTPPVVGTAISFASVTPTTLSVNWGAATDAITAQASLEYKVVKDNAATANIDTVAEVDAKAGGDLLQDYTANITTKAVTGLAASTTYHFAIVVRDAAGNKAIYAPASQATTADSTAPTVGTAISFSSISATTMSVNWGAATDAVTPQANLEYRVVKDNAATANIDTVAEVDAKSGGDLLQDYTANITTKAVTGLTATTTYHFAVVVRDAAGNKAIYAPASQATADATNHIVISEISTTDTAGTGGCSGAACEYIELFNPTSSSITVDNWVIRSKTSNGTLAAFITITATTCANATYTAYTSSCVIPARGFLLLKSGQISISGSRTSGSAVITGLASTASLLAGDIIGSGSTGIPTGTTILSVDSGTQITLSANATSTGGPSAILFGADRFYIPANGAKADFLMAGNSSPGLSNTNNGIQLQTAAKAGTRTSGSAVITGVTDTSGLFIGASISGTGIPAGATILSFITNTSVTMSANATSTSSATWIPVIDSVCFGTHTLATGCEGASATITVTGDTTITNPTITNISSTAGLATGYFVTATPSNVPALSTILSFVPSTSVTLSANATATATGVSFNFNAGTGTAANPATTGAIERKAKTSSVAADMMLGGTDYTLGNSEDTEVNSADFVSITTKNPQNRYTGGTE